MKLFTKEKQTHTHRKQMYGYQRDQQGGREINEKFSINIYYNTIYKVNQQGPNVQNRELYSISCNNL